MKSGDRISIAMATCNGEKFLREQLSSIYSQTLLPDEVIVVDDCSDDTTPGILQEFKTRSGFSYHRNTVRSGPNKTFERALSLCSGDYIAISDQDDVWMPTKIEVSYLKIREIEDGFPALVTSACINTDEYLKPLGRVKNRADSASYMTTLFGHHSQGSSSMMNRKLLDKVLPFPSDPSIVYDIYIGLTAAMTGKKFFIGQPLMFWRHHSSNFSAGISENGTSLNQVLRERACHRYYDLIPEPRFRNMEIVRQMHSGSFRHERVELFDKILELNYMHDIPRQVGRILSFGDLTLARRIKCTCSVILSHFLRAIYKQ